MVRDPCAPVGPDAPPVSRAQTFDGISADPGSL
jgi:hypothetical protein